MANELHFPLFHGYVDRWLVSGVTETPVIKSRGLFVLPFCTQKASFFSGLFGCALLPRQWLF